MLKMELTRISTRPIFWILLIIGLLIGILPVIQMWPHEVTNDYYLFYPRSPYVSWMYLETPSIYFIYSLIFPLLASLAFSDTYAEDYNSGLIKGILTKVEKKKYLITRYFVNFFIGGFIAALPLIVNYLGSMTAFPLIENNYFFGMTPVVSTSYWPELFYRSPLLYIIIRILFIFLLGGMLSSIGIALSTMVKNRYIVLVFPFLLFMGLDVLMPAIGEANFSLSFLFLWNYSGHWLLQTYLAAGILGSFIWFYLVGMKNETI